MARRGAEGAEKSLARRGAEDAEECLARREAKGQSTLRKVGTQRGRECRVFMIKKVQTILLLEGLLLLPSGELRRG